MKEFIAFVLPVATALTGMRLNRLIIGEKIQARYGIGFRFLSGLAVGMLVFSQAVLAGALLGINAAGLLAWLAIVWGGVELLLLVWKSPLAIKSLKFQPSHIWLLLLLPLLYSWWIFGRLSTLEGTLEFDANAFWVFKSKILYFEQGKNLVHVIHQSNLGYTHMDYPMLVPCLYTLGYGAVGGVDEFVNKVWPFWMMVALALGIFSLAKLWKHPHPLPIAAVTLIAFLPASLEFIRNEGGTIPMVFYISLATLLLAEAFSAQDEVAPALSVIVFAGCISTKLEGAVYAAICFCPMLAYAVRRRWFKSMVLWKSAAVAFVCLLPYFFFRLAKPILHPQSEWWRDGLAAPLSALHRLPQVWFMDVGARFFSADFFHWKADNDHLRWAGHWAGPAAFVNEQLSVLPWLLAILLLLSLIFKPGRRLTIFIVSLAVLGTFTFLSTVIACLPDMRKDLSQAIDFGCITVGRYYYPFFVAWFLGIISLWFTQEKAPSTQPVERKAAGAGVPGQKQRR